MLLPHPESDLSLNIMVLGSEIIALLKRYKRSVFIDDIMNPFLEKDSRRTPEYFFDTITFLYMLDIINYTGYKIKLKRNDYTQKTLF